MLGNRVTQRSARAFAFTQTANCYNKGSISARQKEIGMPATVPVPELVQSVPELEEEQPTKITGSVLTVNRTFVVLHKKAMMRYDPGMA